MRSIAVIRTTTLRVAARGAGSGPGPLLLLAACLALPWTIALAVGGKDSARVDKASPPMLAPETTGPRAEAVVPEMEALTTLVPLPPLRWLVAGIAGESVEIGLLVPPGASAEDYDPSPQEIGRFARTRLFFALDTPVERRWLPRLQHLNPDLQVVPLHLPDPQLDWSGQLLPFSRRVVPAADPMMDFHGWTSPAVLLAWVDPIVAAFSKAQPQEAAAFAARGERMRAELETLDRELAALLEPYRGRSFLTLHPAWGYFAHRYGLHQLTLEEQGREPGPRTLARVLAAARTAEVQQIFVPPRTRQGFVRQAAGQLAAEVVEVDELAEDYPATLRRFAAALVRGFGA
ncbi:MAG TPA: hypothetical protein DCY89_00975 [Gammaproteobacteria bacterium]|nr:hypothetical protein [Gammaproteobacteria bacterium]